jgi:hypothetical protein
VDNTNTNVYVADAGTGSIVQVGLDISSQASVLSGLTTPSGVTVDPAGNVYAVDSGKATITRLPYISGSINPNFKTTLASVVKLPAAIASDNLGNLYVADTTDAAVATDNRSTGLLTFGNLTVGDTSNTTAASISNGGTASFSLSTPYYTQSGATSSFAIQSSSTCAAGATLTTGESCTVAANFTPQSYGTLVDMLTLASTAPNAASIDLSGVGTPVLIKSTLTLAVTSSGTPTYPQPVTVTATLVPASQAASAPTGTVTFVVDNQAQPPVNLNSNGTASITLTGLTGGAHTITASYSGDYFYSYTTSSPLTVTLGQSSTTTTLAINAPDVNPTAANPGQAVSLIATVTPPASGTPTGTVTFYNGTTVLGTAPVQAASANKVSFGQATLTISTLALGQYEVTATYSGDVNYTGSSSTTPVPLLIANPTIAMVPSANTLLGDGAPITLSINSIAGYTGAVDFSCTGLPAYSACSFSPAYAQVSPTNNAPVLFSVVINQPPVIAVPAGMGASANLPGRPALAACITLCLLLPGLLFGLARRAGAKTIAGFSVMRLLSFIAFVLLTGGAVALSGCGNSSTASYLTPKGTSTITLSATVTVVNPNPPPSGPPDVVNPPPAVSIPIQLTVN